MKVFEATANGGVVNANGGVVPNCPILGEGLGQSEGYLVMSGDELVYLPKTTPDVKAFMEIMVMSLGIIASQILPANLGGKITEDGFATNIVAEQTKLQELMGMLK